MLRLAMILGSCLLLAAASCDGTQNKNLAKCDNTQGDSPDNSAPSESATRCDTPAESPKACANTPLEECLSNEKCLILGGQRFDAARRCRFPVEQVACVLAASVSICTDAYTFTTDSSGTRWVFYNGCVPEGKGWEKFQPSTAELEAADGLLCN